MQAKTGTTTILYLFVAFFVAMFSACRQEAPAPKPITPSGTFSVNGSIREMTITPETPDFPEKPGKTEFTNYCGICHSLRYITMQPDFPKKTWAAEVSKMIVKYKAPIDSVTAGKIVDYLVSVKAKQ